MLVKRFAPAMVGLIAFAACQASAELAAIKKGLVYNVDASAVATITTNAAGRVTEWRSKGGMADLVFTGGTITGHDNTYYPKYTPASYNGLGAIRFGLCQTNDTLEKSTWMVGSPREGFILTNRTVFVVFDLLGYTQKGVQVWGKDGDRNQAMWYSNNKRLEKMYFFSGTPSINVSGTIWTPPSGQTYFGSISGGRLYGIADTPRIYTNACIGRAYHSWDNVETYYNKNLSDGTCTNHFFRGTIAQIIVYDRELDSDEAAYMINALKLKWDTNAGKTVLWTAAGDGVRWSDPANWKGGAVPGDGDVAEIGARAVTVDGDAVCYRLEAADSRITVAPGASLSITNALYATGNTLFTVGAGGELRVNNSTLYPECAGAGASFALNGGSLVKDGEGVFRFQHSGAVTGDGELRVERGTVDLNGTTQTVTSVSGRSDAQIRNLAAAGAVLRISGDGERTLAVPVLDDVTVECAAGGLKFGVAQRYEGATVLDGVRLSAATNFSPASIPGLVLHVDASRADTVVTNHEGKVFRWLSLAQGGGYFYSRPKGTDKFQVGNTNTVWSSTMMNGRPGVGFSSSAYPMTATNAMVFSKSTTNRTIVAVLKNGDFTTNRSLALGGEAYGPGAWDGSANGGAFGIALNYNVGYYYNYYMTEQRGAEYEHVDGFASIDGKTVYDPQGGVTNAMLTPLGKGMVQLVVMTAPSSWHGTVYNGSSKGDVFTVWLGKCLNQAYWAGVFSEICIYDRPLTAVDREMLERHLIEKWGVTPLAELSQYQCTLPPATRLELSGGAAVDMSGMTQKVAAVTADGGAITNGELTIGESLAVAVGGEGAPATLQLSGDIDLTGVDFSFTGGGRPSAGVILKTDGAVSGPFKTADVPVAKWIKYRGHEVRYGLWGLLMMLR